MKKVQGKCSASDEWKKHRKTSNIVTFSVDKTLPKKYNCENMNK